MRTTPSSTTPEVPEVLSGVTISVEDATKSLKRARDAATAARKVQAAKLSAAREAVKAAKIAAASAPKVRTARDVVRDADTAIIQFAGQLVELMGNDPMAAEVAKLISAQLHHLASPSVGWPEGALPVPDRSEWR